jgi:auxin influx carrier (AUX1 LAX family)
MGSGITLQILFATCALYTNYLLVNLHTEFRKRLAANKNDPRSDDPHYIVSYHDIMGGLIGPKSKTFALLVVILALYGLSVVQIISTGSNMYLLYDGLSKRTWSIIAGCSFSLVVFIPNFRHYRLMVILANIATTYTSWFMTINAALIGPIPDVIYDAPRNVEDWFRGMVSLLFCFGGHASNIEVADVMDDHSTYDKSYFYSFLYVFTLTMPNAITAYHTFGNEARLNQNAFGLYEQSPARDFGIVMMTINNLVAYGLFLGPL